MGTPFTASRVLDEVDPFIACRDLLMFMTIPLRYLRTLRYHLKSFSGIDLAISKALKQKKNFNEGKFVGWATKPMPRAA